MQIDLSSLLLMDRDVISTWGPLQTVMLQNGWTLSSIYFLQHGFIFKYYKHRKLQLLYSEHLYTYDFGCISKQVALSLAFQNMYHEQKFTVYLWVSFEGRLA